MRGRQRTSADKVMIAVLSFANFLGIAFGVFAVASIATHTFDMKTGLKAVGAFAILPDLLSSAAKAIGWVSQVNCYHSMN